MLTHYFKIAALLTLAPTVHAGGSDIGTVFCTCFEGLAAPCAVPDPLAGCANSTGTGATLLGTGSASVLADDLQLVVANVQPHEFGLLFMGGAQISVPFGDGLRCVAPGPPDISRFFVKQANASGSFVEGPGIVAHSETFFSASAQIIAGCTYQFQGWYRDPGGSCGSSFNLTNGLQVTFNAGGELTTVRGNVFYDFNQNGVLDDIPEEGPLEGWKVRLESDCGVSETFTDANGDYAVVRDRNSLQHVVTSIAPAPGFIGDVNGRWLATTPNPVNVVADTADIEVDFANVFFTNQNPDAPTLAAGVGFWHNAGESLLVGNDPAWRELLNGLCLRTNLTQADPLLQAETLFLLSVMGDFGTEFQRFSDYLVDTDVGVLAYTLSIQFAAANLNAHFGPLQDFTVFVDQQGDGVLVSLPQMIENTTALLCMPCAANSGPGGDVVCRTLIMGCLLEWEDINSHGDKTFTPSKDTVEFSFQSPY